MHIYFEILQVKLDSLKGKIGLYFSASWCGPCQRFTPILAEVYNELSRQGDFEVIFVSGDEDDEAFKGYFSKMPWLAVPFSDSETRDKLDELFKVMGIPHLVILDENGKVLSDGGVEIIREYGVEGYPFTVERIKEMKEQEERAKREQSLRSVLTSHSRDFVISSDGRKVFYDDVACSLKYAYSFSHLLELCLEMSCWLPNLNFVLDFLIQDICLRTRREDYWSLFLNVFI